MEIGLVGFGAIALLGMAGGVVLSLLAPKTYAKIQNKFRDAYFEIRD